MCVCLTCAAVQFTQLDMEMAFMDSDAIMSLAEELIITVLREVQSLYF